MMFCHPSSTFTFKETQQQVSSRLCSSESSTFSSPSSSSPAPSTPVWPIRELIAFPMSQNDGSTSVTKRKVYSFKRISSDISFTSEVSVYLSPVCPGPRTALLTAVEWAFLLKTQCLLQHCGLMTPLGPLAPPASPSAENLQHLK